MESSKLCPSKEGIELWSLTQCCKNSATLYVCKQWSSLVSHQRHAPSSCFLWPHYRVLQNTCTWNTILDLRTKCLIYGRIIVQCLPCKDGTGFWSLSKPTRANFIYTSLPRMCMCEAGLSNQFCLSDLSFTSAHMECTARLLIVWLFFYYMTTLPFIHPL